MNLKNESTAKAAGAASVVALTMVSSGGTTSTSVDNASVRSLGNWDSKSTGDINGSSNKRSEHHNYQ